MKTCYDGIDWRKYLKVDKKEDQVGNRNIQKTNSWKIILHM